MEFGEMASTTARAVSGAGQTAARFVELERVLAMVCLLIPLVLIVFDGGTIRKSISDYYNMDANQVFCFSLTVASMLFFMNGVVHKRHWSNWVLGLLLRKRPVER